MLEKQLSSVTVFYNDGTIDKLKNAMIISMDNDNIEFDSLNINPADQLLLTAILLNELVKEYFVEGDDEFEKFSMLLTSFIKELMKVKNTQTKGAIYQ